MNTVCPYIIFSTASFVVATILSKLLNFSLQNTWQAALALAAVFGPYGIWGWKVSKNIRTIHPFLSLFLRFCVIALVIGFLSGIIVLIVSI